MASYETVKISCGEEVEVRVGEELPVECEQYADKIYYVPHCKDEGCGGLFLYKFGNNWILTNDDTNTNVTQGIGDSPEQAMMSALHRWYRPCLDPNSLMCNEDNAANDVIELVELYEKIKKDGTDSKTVP